MTQIESGLRRGIHFIATQQRADGGFDSFSSSSQHDFARAFRYQTIFVPALMLAALTALQTPESKKVRQKLAAYLLEQKGPHGAFNYWAKDAPERQTMPYPDDLDDTFCALIGLWLHDSTCIDQAILASTVKILLATETSVGGPYKTWLKAPDGAASWQDVDLAVNSNIAYFLNLVSEPLPNLMALMDGVITTKRLHSPYYPSEYQLLYYVSRAYRGMNAEGLGGLVRALQPKTALQYALAITARLRLNIYDGTGVLVRHLLALQQADGSWPAEAFCIDPARKSVTHYNGAPALTTALALEALALYQGFVQADTSHQLVATKSIYPNLQTQVLQLAQKQTASLGSDLRSQLLRSLQVVMQSDNGSEILELAPAFAGSSGIALKTPDILHLSLANLYGWVAYTIYDDFLDDEGNPELLSIANVAMRKSLQNFRTVLPNNIAFQELVQETFDRMDSANMWEITHCRFTVKGIKIHVGTLPQYGNLQKLAERSLGHTLAPMAVLMAKSTDDNSKIATMLQKSLRHYLIAKQLNDDAHDWQEDMQKGHITYVVAEVLRQANIQAGEHKLEALLSKLQKQFWHTVLPDICRTMQRQVRLSRQTLKLVEGLQTDNIIGRLLDGIDASIAETLRTQSEAIKFLEHYS
jgi:hypothetical protein